MLSLECSKKIISSFTILVSKEQAGIDWRNVRFSSVEDLTQIPSEEARVS